MIIELGNHAVRHPSFDDAPKVTTIHIPESDKDGLGGYTHKPGLSVEDFRKEIAEAMMFRDGIYRLPDHEALLATHLAWQAESRERPAWLQVTETELTPKGIAKDLEAFLHEHFSTGGERKPVDVEDRYWTKFGEPGRGEPTPPDITNLFVNDGRTQQAVNYGGGQTGAIGTGTAATATSLTTASTFTTNQWAGYRVYCMQTSTGPLVWGNVISNTNAAGASVLTVDRWYNAATPGGAAATTPSAGYQFVLADGGVLSNWFVGLSTTNITPAATDHAMTSEYTVTAGGYYRKIAPYALTSGTSPMTFTLTPVFTGLAGDTYPTTFYAAGFFNSMVPADTTLAMKFETSMNASATVAATGDQVTLTETVTGS
jgi:hypothetical protein